MNYLKNKYDVYNDRLSSIHESVFKIGDTYKVKTTINVPKSLINAFVSKAKKANSIDPRENWSDTDLAEMFITYISTHFLNIDSLPVDAILGEPDSTKEEVSTVVTDEEIESTDTDDTDVNIEINATDDDGIKASIETMDEGLMDTLRGGSKEEIAKKEKELSAKLDELIKNNSDLVFNGKPVNKEEVMKVMKKNNFLGTLTVIDAKFSKYKKPTLSYKEGVKGLGKLAAGTNGARG
jgi:hypothetical protein